VEDSAAAVDAGLRREQLDLVAPQRDGAAPSPCLGRISPHDLAIGRRRPQLEAEGRSADEGQGETVAQRTFTTVEAISPELALVDPELGRAHLALLDERREQAPVVTGTPSETWWTGAAKIVAALSLAANGFLAAFVIAHPRPASAAPTTTAAPPTAPSAAAASVGPRAAVEQRILALVAGAERSRLPSTLLDRATGLPVNNLQAVCHGKGSGSMRCLVRPAQHRPGEGLGVRYTPGAGAGSFTWYPYRTG
jgi:hypothetical protein